MRLLCSLGWHRPSTNTIDNEGRTFSRCRSCGIDLVKASHGWKPAPKGYRVIWKKPAGPAKAASQRQKKVEETSPAAKPAQAEETSPAAKPALPEQTQKKSTRAPKKSSGSESKSATDSPPRRRKQPERRKAGSGELPPELEGKERRSGEDRRRTRSKKADSPSE